MLDSPDSAFGLMLFFYLGMLALTIGGLAVAWFRRSIVMAALGEVLVLLIGCGLFAMMSDVDDPAFTGWLGWWRTDCVAWCFVLIAGVANLIALIQLRRL